MIPSKTPVALTESELLTLLAAAQQRSARDHAMMLLAYRHGLRASEVCKLTLDDLDMRSGHISIARLKGSLFTIQSVNRHRGQPLLDEVRVLRAWLDVRPADSGNALFVSQKGGKLSRSQFFRIFQTVARSIGLPEHKCHPHVLKASLATHLVRQNCNLMHVKQALGHAAIGSTMRYIHVQDAESDTSRQNALMSCDWVRAAAAGAR
jgi:site-specific recombinase XerD